MSTYTPSPSHSPRPKKISTLVSARISQLNEAASRSPSPTKPRTPSPVKRIAVPFSERITRSQARLEQSDTAASQVPRDTPATRGRKPAVAVESEKSPASHRRGSSNRNGSPTLSRKPSVRKTSKDAESVRGRAGRKVSRGAPEPDMRERKASRGDASTDIRGRKGSRGDASQNVRGRKLSRETEAPDGTERTGRKASAEYRSPVKRDLAPRQTRKCSRQFSPSPSEDYDGRKDSAEHAAKLEMPKRRSRVFSRQFSNTPIEDHAAATEDRAVAAEHDASFTSSPPTTPPSEEYAASNTSSPPTSPAPIAPTHRRASILKPPRTPTRTPNLPTPATSPPPALCASSSPSDIRAAFTAEWALLQKLEANHMHTLVLRRAEIYELRVILDDVKNGMLDAGEAAAAARAVKEFYCGEKRDEDVARVAEEGEDLWRIWGQDEGSVQGWVNEDEEEFVGERRVVWERGAMWREQERKVAAGEMEVDWDDKSEGEEQEESGSQMEDDSAGTIVMSQSDDSEGTIVVGQKDEEGDVVMSQD
ncbi:hypothetical protein EDC01DRAFT_760475 [Geopyxis carbonaria]|nr:hypothetical protein EDC01DRAFT_760475 [Geopyxis carbonaria]